MIDPVPGQVWLPTIGDAKPKRVVRIGKRFGTVYALQHPPLTPRAHPSGFSQTAWKEWVQKFGAKLQENRT